VEDGVREGAAEAALRADNLSLSHSTVPNVPNSVLASRRGTGLCSKTLEAVTQEASSSYFLYPFNFLFSVLKFYKCHIYVIRAANVARK
jgi:hypothetical protein